MSIRIAISSGDFNGIGPEVIIKTLQASILADVTPIILSSQKVIDFYLNELNLELDYHLAASAREINDGIINLLDIYGEEQPSVAPGSLTKQSGYCSMLAVEQGIKLCQTQKVDALVTAPISKEAVNLAGYHIPGHTEFLAEKTSTTDFIMMLVNEGLRVGLMTTHVPVAEVSGLLSQALIYRYITLMNSSLREDFNILKPRIAVLGLNPHAGDGGVIGMEEIDIISPALHKAHEDDIKADGPFPADGFFGNRKFEHYDGILAMYHDQGLIPFKTLSFGKGVNFTAGLPIIRTSPDHGTAFDIAAEGVADPSSFTQAFKLAVKLVKNRKNKTSG